MWGEMHRCFILTGHAEEWNRHPRRHRWPLKLLKCDPATPAPSLFSWMEGGPNETKPQIQSKSRCCLSSIYRADSSINFDVTAYQHSAPPYDGCLFFHVWRHDLHVVPPFRNFKKGEGPRTGMTVMIYPSTYYTTHIKGLLMFGSGIRYQTPVCEIS